MVEIDNAVTSPSTIADYTALLDARRELDAKLANIRQAAIDEFAQRTLAEAEKLEIDLLDLFASHGIGRRKRTSVSVQIKYRDPSNPDNTWNGRGRPPRWLQDYINAGKAQNEFVAL
jgi:DNA-binding protein H-NS